jgi:predicted acyltransferase
VTNHKKVGTGVGAVFFFFMAILGFAIPNSGYKSAKTDNPDLEFLAREIKLVGLHWACNLFGCITCASATGWILQAGHSTLWMGASGISALAFASLWIACIVSSLNSPEYQATMNYLSHSAYNAYTIAMTRECLSRSSE